MNYPIDTPSQLRGVLRGLRQTRKLSQAQVGKILGVNQKRVAKIESAPGVTSFDQIARVVLSLGGRLVIVDAQAGHTDIGRTKAAPSGPIAQTW